MKFFAATMLLFFAAAFLSAPPALADEVRSEVLLTVAPCPPGLEMDAYLDDIAGSVGAYVAATYTALSMTDDDPILLTIRSEKHDSEALLEALAKDKRVWSASPSRVIKKSVGVMGL